MKTMPKVLSFSLVLAALQVLASPRHAAAYDKAAFVAPEGQALIVFIQNLRADRAVSFVVFDSNKQCAAEVGGRQAAVIPMKPGQYRFYVAGYDTHRIELDLEGGLTYFIRLSTIEKFATRVSEVTLVRRDSDSYMRLKVWLNGARVAHASDDQCRGKPLQERAKRTRKRMNKADADWQFGDDAYRAKYTMRKQDGLTAKDVDRL